MLLRLAVKSAHVILQPTARGVKSVPNRNVQVLVSVVQPRVSIRDDRAASDRQIDPHMINSAMPVVPVARLQHHAAGADAIRELFELIDATLHLRLCCRRWFHAAKGDLYVHHDSRLLPRLV